MRAAGGEPANLASSVTLEDVRAAHDRIRPWIHRTPVFRSATFDRELGATLLLKAENLQKTGAFKARGALNAVLTLSDDEARRGVLTHSSGNHAAALAWAASIRGVRCTVVMPETAPAIKQAAVRGYGAAVRLCPPDAREQTAAAVQAETGATLIHPFEHPAVIAGQGTAALELLEDHGPLDILVTPVGGGGLLAGTTLVAAALAPTTRVHGAEPAAAADAARSLTTGTRQPAIPSPATVADGLLTGLGARPFAILRAADVAIVVVDEAAILTAARDLLQRTKLLVEPSGATVLAACRTRRSEWSGLRIGAILSGGNTDLAWLTKA